MAIFTIVGGLIAGAIGLGGATLFGVSVGSLIGGALAFGTQLGLAYLNRPKKRAYSAVQGQREYGARVPATALYGTGKMMGHHIFYAKYGAGNKYNADVFVLANGWCDGLEPEIYFYGQKHTLVPRTIIGNEVAHYGVDGFDNLISIRFYDGRPGQGPDTKLVSDTAALGQNWKATSVCAGMAYVVVEREWSEAKFDKGQPDFEFVFRGLRLYDPRKDSTVAGGSGPHRLDDPSTWEFSKNPALQRLNYQLGLRGLVSGRTLIGEGKSLGQLDLGSYFAAMNACDALRNGKPTYEASLLVTSDDDHTEVLKEFDDAMAGYGMNRRGLSGVIAGAPQIPVLALGPDDIDMGRPKSIKHRKSAFDLYNQMSGQYISTEANWTPASLNPIVVNADVNADGRPRQIANDFLQVTSADIAQYLLQIRYRQQRKGGSATVPVSRRAGFRVQEGEWITYAGKTWLVTNWSCDEELQVTLTLAETGPDVYSSGGIEPGPIVVPPTPPVNPSLLSTVQDFDVEAGMITGEDGYEQPVLRLTWSPPEDPTITRVRFQYQIQGSTDAPFEDATDDVEAGEYITTKNVMSGKVYVARATIVTVPDRFKAWTSWATTATITGLFAYPVSIDNLREDIRGFQDWAGSGLREIERRLEEYDLWMADQDFGNAFDRQKLRQQITATYENSKAEWTYEVNLLAAEGVALGQRIETLTATVGDNTASIQAEAIARANADSALAADILELETEVFDPVTGLPAVANAVDALETYAGPDGALAQAVTQLSAATTPGEVNEANFRMQAVAGPAGYSTIGAQTRVGGEGAWRGAAWFLQTPNNPLLPTRFVVDAQQMSFGDTSSGSLVNPLVYSGGQWYLENVRIGTLKFDQLESNNGKLVIRGAGNDAYIRIST